MPAAGLVSNLLVAAAVTLPGTVIVYTSFQGGGFFGGTQAMLAALLAVLLAVRLAFVRTLPRPTLATAVAAGALGLFAVWTLVSLAWSHAPARAVLEFDRALLYLLTLVFFASLPITVGRLRWMLRGVALAAVAVSGVGFVSRTLPSLLPIESHPSRLAYPITYENAVGLLGVLGALFALYMTTSEREPRTVRVVAAGTLPLLASTVYLTFSRGAILIGACGLLAYLVLARPRCILTGLLAAAPPVLIALQATYDSSALFVAGPPARAAVAQGRHLAEVVALCSAGALLARAVLLAVEAPILRRPSPWLGRKVLAGAAVLAAVGAIGLLFSIGAPSHLQRQYRLFVERPIVPGSDPRGRLLDPRGSGRSDFWRVAIVAFRTEPVRGYGAGTYQLLWERNRRNFFQLVDGHSLYLESAAELGLVGVLLVAVAVVTLLWASGRRIRGPDRALFAAVFAGTATWAVHAGIDWDWELPVVTLWVFALGGAVLAGPAGLESEPERSSAEKSTLALRLALAVGCLALAVLPLRVAVSQQRLNDGVRAFERGDCPTTVRQALASIDALDVRPEPYELLAYCAVRLGAPAAALHAINNAVRLDPWYWRYQYALALVRGANRLDPRPAVRRARERNPGATEPRDAVAAFRTADRRLWRVRALRAPLPGRYGPGGGA